jgi:predicted O-methyltransferase YrrM
MWLASKVVTHEPEAKPGKIASSRLRAHGWSDDVVTYLEYSDKSLEQSDPSATFDLGFQQSDRVG